MGYRADAVASGLEVLRALETIPYTLVLMDMQMPEMDGIEATGQIRNGKRVIQNPEIPIIALTAHAGKRDQERCLGAGMNDFLTKPVQPDELAKVISRWLPGNGEIPRRQAAKKVLEQEGDFDRTALLERLGGDKGTYEEIIALFLQDAHGQIQSLEEALSSGDGTKAQRQAHTLKSASGNVGAVGLNKVALEIEKACENGDLREAIKMLPMIQTKLEDLKEILNPEQGALL
jgi:CheY-like chemotaxis protein/HPt (histidine-containing phosphotransfer) domain-containing protein